MSEPLYDRDGMARMIRTFFIEHKKQATRRGYKPNPRHDNWENWLKAADACIANRANPKDWVDASFELSPQTVFANQLAGPAAVARWREFTQRTASGIIQTESSNFHKVVETDAPAKSSPEEVLEETDLMESIKAELVLAHMLMLQISGSAKAVENEPVLLDQWVTIRPHIRVAIAGKAGLGAVVRKFKTEAEKFYSVHPDHVACLKTINYDVATYLNAL